ncbi:membrane protein [Streptomyces viridochromogenes]|uniref:Membrane protein n=1 Tax=Streptomyces viridochromogenes TaxID=1938 RepID=A0A0J7ZF90_STRVR|nr:acyltransferase [Streptomyces viridochromogenes]KMS73888.1 membrane protein [Streptomyces viridochromogenes]KOG10960.1 membrane protein [Streptomyces viridochromogenes]KOG26103.1 membrane protein [Streptomyces viridochromogenes]
MSAETQAPATAPRRGELDALRVFVVLGLVFFHAALVFATEGDYYVQNAETTEVITVLAGFGVVWAMPVLFLVAGLGARYSVRRRGARRFARERLVRLGVPLLFTVVALNPLPQWLRQRAADPGHHESYWHFLPRYFTVHLDPADFPFFLDGDHFESGHLWFVLLLLAFCLLLAPVAGRLAAGGDGAARAVVRHPLLLLLPVLPLTLLQVPLGMEEDYAAWHHWAYLVFFLYGFTLAGDERVRAVMRRFARPLGVAGVLLFAACGPGFMTLDDPFTDRTPLALGTRALFSAAGWCLVMAILGALDRPREQQPAGARPSPLMAYLGVAALPMYVLHQPVVVAVAYGVVGWSAPIVVEYAVIVAGSFAVILVLYESVVHRTRVTRFLFGMRAAPGRPAPDRG